MTTITKKVLVVLIAVSGVLLQGCGTPDVDPQAKVDAPGYYNGPMKAKGGAAGGADADASKPAAGGK
jgi:hypothetical protein